MRQTQRGSPFVLQPCDAVTRVRKAGRFAYLKRVPQRGPNRITPTIKEQSEAMSTPAAARSFASRAAGCRSGSSRSTIRSIAVFSASAHKTKAMATIKTNHSIAEIRK